MANKIVLIVDDREREVTKFLPDVFGEQFKVQRITTGDFALMCNDAILAVFERKTLADYAASIKDGRHNNKENLIEFKQQLGCDAYYIVEHHCIPSLSTKIEGIPYKNISNSIIHLMVRDGIFVTMTKSAQNTAERLFAFLEAYEKFRVPQQATGGLEKLKAVRKTSIEDMVIKMWSTLAGISDMTARAIMTFLTIREILLDNATEKIDAVKYEDGRSITIKAKKSLRNMSLEDKYKMISAINGISRNTAQLVFTSLEQNGNLEEIQVGRAKLGAKRAKTICDCLDFCHA